MAIIQSDPCLQNIEVFLTHCRKNTYAAKSIIIYSGDQSDTLYYIISGSVAAVVEDNEGKEITLAYLNPGDFVGEMGLFEEQRRSACIRAKSNCELGEISYDKFFELSTKHPEFLFAVSKQVVKRLRNTSRRVCNLAFLDVSGRVAHTALFMPRARCDTTWTGHPNTRNATGDRKTGRLLTGNGWSRTQKLRGK